VARAIDAQRLAAKPRFPTDEQRAGIAEAARRIHAKETAKDHLGDPTPTYAVVVTGHDGWLHIRHASPYQQRGGGYLWGFTDDDIHAFMDLLDEQGLLIATWWRSDRGVSLRTFPAPKKED